MLCRAGQSMDNTNSTNNDGSTEPVDITELTEPTEKQISKWRIKPGEWAESKAQALSLAYDLFQLRWQDGFASEGYFYHEKSGWKISFDSGGMWDLNDPRNPN